MRQIGEKYQTSGDLTKVDGTPIPDDEPVMLFRASDKLLPQLLEQYIELSEEAGASEDFLASLESRITEIKSWQASHSAKVPD